MAAEVIPAASLQCQQQPNRRPAQRSAVCLTLATAALGAAAFLAAGFLAAGFLAPFATMVAMREKREGS